MSILIPKKKGDGGGGGIGSVLGAIGGGIAAAATGGAALPLIGAGASLGGTAGNMVNPASGGAAPSPIGSAIQSAASTPDAIARAINANENDSGEKLKQDAMADHGDQLKGAVMATAFLPHAERQVALPILDQALRTHYGVSGNGGMA